MATSLLSIKFPTYSERKNKMNIGGAKTVAGAVLLDFHSLSHLVLTTTLRGLIIPILYPHL